MNVSIPFFMTILADARKQKFYVNGHPNIYTLGHMYLVSESTIPMVVTENILSYQNENISFPWAIL